MLVLLIFSIMSIHLQGKRSLAARRHVYAPQTNEVIHHEYNGMGEEESE